MALSTSLPESVGKTHHNSTLSFCLFTSLAMCFTTLTVLPSDPEHVGSSRDKILLAILRVFLSVSILLCVLYAMFLVRKKDRFHQSQQVFWPRLCPHCDRVVNVMEQLSRELDADTPISRSNAVANQEDYHLSLWWRKSKLTCQSVWNCTNGPYKQQNWPLSRHARLHMWIGHCEQGVPYQLWLT